MAVSITLAGASPLEGQMKALGRPFKELKGMVQANKYDYDKVGTIAKNSETAAKKCATLLPEEVEKLQGDAKQKAAADYKKQMEDVAAGYVKLGEAAAKKDDAGIKASFDALRRLMQAGHDEYRKDD